MRIVILGAGQVGSSVAQSLVSEKNDITVVDTDRTCLENLQIRYDLRTVVGNAVLPSTLRDAGIEVALPPILAAHARLAGHADALIVEGVGGWAAPLSASLMQADLVRALRVPVVLVVGLRLGCLNHALLSARAIAADGAHLAGWIASHVDPDMERVDDNIAMLRARMPAPCWGVLPHARDAEPAAMARHLRIPMLAD